MSKSSLFSLRCPSCKGGNLRIQNAEDTKSGRIKMSDAYICESCDEQFILNVGAVLTKWFIIIFPVLSTGVWVHSLLSEKVADKPVYILPIMLVTFFLILLFSYVAIILLKKIMAYNLKKISCSTILQANKKKSVNTIK